MKQKINYSEYVVGCRIGEKIYIHPGLKEYDLELYSRIMDHEKKHTEHLEKSDILMDLNNEELKGYKGKYWKFVLTHPKTWVGFLPFSRIDGTWSLDVALLALWLLAITGGAVLSLTW